MTRWLIPDSGPLFSLAAGDLLDLFLHFRLGITDVVKQKTIDRGAARDASVEAKRLHSFFKNHGNRITVLETQVGRDLGLLRAQKPRFKSPKNAGELSIQSLLIELQVRGVDTPPVIVFEDAWFLRHAPSLARPCVLISTQAFLVQAQSLGLIASATQAREAIAACRPDAQSSVASLTLTKRRLR